MTVLSANNHLRLNEYKIVISYRKRAKNARGISLPSSRQHYLVAMATSLA